MYFTLITDLWVKNVNKNIKCKIFLTHLNFAFSFVFLVEGGWQNK